MSWWIARSGRGVHVAAETMVVLLCATVVVAIVVALTRDATVRSDQEELNLIVEKRLHPEILPRDALFSSPIIVLYTPSFIALQTAVARRTGGDPVTALEILVWPFGIVFLAGHYVLFRGVTGSPLASALGAISALTVRNAPGSEYWGFDGLRAVQPRTVLGGLTPVLLLLFLRWRTRRGFPFYFLGLGALANVHPVSAFHLWRK